MTVSSLLPNPDSTPIAKKNTIDISYSSSDVSASFGGFITSNSIQTNLVEQKIILMSVPLEYDSGSFVVPSVYYTPVYTEQINYDEWKKLNRTFSELSL